MAQILCRANVSWVCYGHSRLEICNMEVSELLTSSQWIYISRGLFAALQLGPVTLNLAFKSSGYTRKSLDILYKSQFSSFLDFLHMGGIVMLTKKCQFSLVSRFSLRVRSWRTNLFRCVKSIQAGPETASIQ